MKKKLTKVCGLREVTCRSTSSELDGSMLEQPPTSTLAPHSPHCSPQNPFSLSPAGGGQFQKTTKYESPPLPHPLLLSSCLEVVPCCLALVAEYIDLTQAAFVHSLLIAA